MKLDWLTKHRQKPKHVRDNIAFTISASFTVVLAVVWFVFGSESKLFDSVARREAASPRVFSTFWDQLSEQMASVKEAIPEPPATSTSAFPTSQSPGSPEEQAAYETLQKEAVIRVVPTASSSTSTNLEGATSSVIY